VRAANSGTTTTNTLVTAANSTATQANSAAQSSGGLFGGLGSLFKAIPLVGMLFEKGGIVSAQGGMVLGSGASFAMLHPQEMVLPSHLSTGIQSAINAGTFGRGGNTYGATLNHSPTININGGGAMNRSQFEGLLRTHGDVLLSHARNLVRNGWAPA
jgi:hypothetical protein